MNLFQIIILIGLGGNIVFGLFVLLSNPKRAANIGFFTLAVLASLWLSSMFMCSVPRSISTLMFWVRQTSAMGGLIPFGIFILQLTIMYPELTLLQALRRLRYWLLACFSMMVLCHSSIFVLSVTNPTEHELVPPTEYGYGFLLYLVFFLTVIASLVFNFWKVSKGSVGSKKVELQFLQMGCCFGLILGVSLLASAEVLDKQEISLFIPLSALVLDGFVAYGIATRRILAVSAVLQRVVANFLMMVYLIVLYMCSAWAGDQVFRWFVDDPHYLAHLLATLILAFAVMPTRSWMHRFSHRLFSSTNQFDVNRVMKEAGLIFQEILTEDHLMASFSSLIIRTFKTTRMVLLKPGSDGVYRQHYAFPEHSDELSLAGQSGLIQLLTRDHEPFTIDTLERMRSSSPVIAARNEMRSLDVSMAAGSFAHKQLEAVILLFPKTNGAIYDLREQRALQLLCDQLAVALENARLYTEIQNSKIYNEILLDSMASGLVAVDKNLQITVFNQRAQAITGLSLDQMVHHSLTVLPGAMVKAIETILQTGAGFRDKDMVIPAGEGQVPIRVSGSVFHSHTGKTIGALLVFSDMTILRKMEGQIRRTDRLSSIGTLSAGMAHEIKNPLVTIKTFTDLLPYQYNDDQFRHTFFELVGQEVQRIDTIVNRLLNFARPAQVSLKPILFHDVVENSLRLVEQQLARQGIRLEKKLGAKHHLLMADSEQLNQTFVNFFLNAIQAMESGGVLSVTTTQLRSQIRLDVGDTGCGLSEEQRKHIFDPFFTTKEDGVGLGLSVSHGIIQEHDGTIDVESAEGRGTVFHVELPLMDETEVVGG
ncbi:MAG: PAS domain-containing protein [Kiritimatiellales bacterium]|nr:PAS domain-containing protein [Kiritimatiellota bacterium]MBL7011825.1 PAS domain-containing protein [Kiritimatiellales bacterium]